MPARRPIPFVAAAVPVVRFVVLVALGSLATFASQARPGPKAMAAGGFPVTFMHASAWFAHAADPATKRLTLIVYFVGRPGWHDRQTKFNWTVNGSPATIDMTVGDIPIHVTYRAETSAVEILGQSFNLSDGNVFFVEAIDTPTPAVRSLGVHDLSFASDANPATVLLKRNAPVREALLGRKAARTVATSPTTKPAREVIAWDDEGMRLINRGRPEDARKACKLFRRAAEKGYAESQYRLGYCYESGGGIPADPAVANQWYLKAANQGHVHAQYKLAHGYRVGRGVAVDLAVALDWYRKAAAQGDLDALHNVAWMHATSQGVPASAESAFEWFRKAAERGAVGSQFEVAKRLLNGDGTPRNVTESHVWLLILRAQRNTIAPEDRQQVEALLQAVKPDLTPEAESAAQARALELMKDLSQRFLEELGNS